MNSSTRALIFSYSDCANYFVGTTLEPLGISEKVEYEKDGNGKLRKFPSLYRAKQHLIEMGFDKGWLVLQSPYDEMIGNERAQKSELPVLLVKDALDK